MLTQFLYSTIFMQHKFQTQLMLTLLNYQLYPLEKLLPYLETHHHRNQLPFFNHARSTTQMWYTSISTWSTTEFLKQLCWSLSVSWLWNILHVISHSLVFFIYFQHRKKYRNFTEAMWWGSPKGNQLIE